MINLFINDQVRWSLKGWTHRLWKLLITAHFIRISCRRWSALLLLDSMYIMYDQGSLKRNLVNGFTNRSKELLFNSSPKVSCPFTRSPLGIFSLKSFFHFTTSCHLNWIGLSCVELVPLVSYYWDRLLEYGQKHCNQLHLHGSHSYSTEIAISIPFGQRRLNSLTSIFEAFMSIHTLV